VVLKLDPRYRLLWRSPTSLQFGLDRPPVVLSELGEADDRMLAQLIRGISRSGLSMVAEDAGVGEAAVTRLLDAVSPILCPDTESPAPDRHVSLTGAGRTADDIAATLEDSGITVHRTDRGDAETPGHIDLAIIVAQFVIDPELHGAWLRRDVPHLAVVYGDASVRVGPVVEPGGTACLYCVERHTTDADPAWPAIESQLWGARSPCESALVTSEVVALVTRYAVSRLGGHPLDQSPLAPATSLRLDAETGRITERVWTPHPECACLRLPGNPARPESDSADARRAGRRSPRAVPRRGAGALAPA